MNLSRIFTVARKDIMSQFDHPTAYIVLGVFLVLWEFLFFRSVFLVGEASLRILFDMLPWLLIFVVPAVTMGSISQEKNDGTFELLITHPVEECEIILGKFAASVVFLALAFSVAAPIAISFSVFGNVDWGVVLGQYIGSLLFSSALAALGIFISSLVASPIASLLVTAVSGFFFVILGFEIVTSGLPPLAAVIAEKLSMLSHFEPAARGIIDLRDVWYFLSVIVIFLSLSQLHILKFKSGAGTRKFRFYKVSAYIFIFVAIATNLIGNGIPGRVDLTENRLYTLTSATKNVLSSLTENVNITLYASGNLPAQFQPVLRDTKDVLRDYRIYGKGNVVVTYRDPGADKSAAQEASAFGVREEQFNVVGQGEFKVQSGFLGVAVSHSGKHETIPFLRNTDNLEYQLTSFIEKLTRKDKKHIFFLAGHGEKSPSGDYRILYGEMEKQFIVDDLEFGDETKEVPGDAAAIVIAGPLSPVGDSEREALHAYIGSGGSIFFLIDAMSVNMQSLAASRNQNSFRDFVYNYGALVNQDIVYDLRSNETVRFSNGPFSTFLLPYPFWARTESSGESGIAGDAENVLIPWGSSISMNDNALREEGLFARKLFATSRFGGSEDGSGSLSPQARPPQAGLGEQVVAVAISGDDPKADGTTVLSETSPRIAVVGDSDFLTDGMIKRSPQNLVFGMSVLSWLSREEKSSLSGIQARRYSDRRLIFTRNSEVLLVKYGNMLFAVAALITAGVLRLMRRRRLRRFCYCASSL